jgi:hypothetical protein
MRRHTKSKYIRGHGYIRYIYRSPSLGSIHGDGIGDIFSSIFKAGSRLLTKIPSKLVDASKSALLNVGSSTIKAVGSKVGDTIADKIVSKNIKATPAQDQDIRRQILKELNFEQPSKSTVEAADSKEPTQVNNKTEANSQGIPGDLYKQLYGSGTKSAGLQRNRGQTLIGRGIKIL